MISANLMHEAGHPKLVLWDNSEVWGGEGGGRRTQYGGTHIHSWLIHGDIWPKPPVYIYIYFIF